MFKSPTITGSEPITNYRARIVKMFKFCAIFQNESGKNKSEKNLYFFKSSHKLKIAIDFIFFNLNNRHLLCSFEL